MPRPRTHRRRKPRDRLRRLRRQLRVDDFFELLERLCAREQVAVDEERRRTVHPDLVAVSSILIDLVGVGLLRDALVELRTVEADVLCDLLELVRTEPRLVLEQLGVVFPE